MRWEPFEPRSPNAGAGHSADAAKRAISPGLEWRSWRTTGSQSRESFIPGPTSVSPSGTRGKSRMHKGARTDPCGGCGVTRTPTATRRIICLTVLRFRRYWIRRSVRPRDGGVLHEEAAQGLVLSLARPRWRLEEAAALY